MGERSRSFMGIRRTKRRPNLRRRFCKSSSSSASGSSTVSDKLEALKNLIPAHIDGGGGRREIKTDELFKETADYIVLLRTQISVLQQLVDFYGSDAAANAGAGQQQEPQQNP